MNLSTFGVMGIGKPTQTTGTALIFCLGCIMKGMHKSLGKIIQ